MIVIYDFDGTLTPYSMPKFEVLEKCGMSDGAMNPKFMEMVKENAKVKNIDLYSSIYDVYFQLIKDAKLSLTDDNFCLGSENVQYNKGVYDFLQFLSENGVKNYVVSSGLKVFLERTDVSSLLDGIYATTFIYDINGNATKVDYLMSDKNKVEAIKDIINSNGLSDCQKVIYIGDGLTDYSAMEYVKSNGGVTVFVYKNKDSLDLKRLEEMDVVSFSTYADFSDNGELFHYVKKLCLTVN